MSVRMGPLCPCLSRSPPEYGDRFKHRRSEDRYAQYPYSPLRYPCPPLHLPLPLPSPPLPLPMSELCFAEGKRLCNNSTTGMRHPQGQP